MVDRRPSFFAFLAACAAAAALALLDVNTPDVAKLMGVVIEKENVNDGLRPVAIHYAWRHGMDVAEVVDRIVRDLQRRRPYYQEFIPKLIGLLGEIGPDARKAIPVLEAFADDRYEFARAAEAALKRIRR